MFYIKYNEQDLPYKMGLNTRFKFEKLTGQSLSEDVFNKQENVIILLYCCLEVGCRVEEKEIPFKSVFDFTEAIENNPTWLNEMLDNLLTKKKVN